MNAVTRTVLVGSQEYLQVTLKEVTGQSLLGTSVELAVFPVGTPLVESLWAGVPEITITGSSLTAQTLFTGRVVGTGKSTSYRVLARLTDNPEKIVVDCGTFVVRAL